MQYAVIVKAISLPPMAVVLLLLLGTFGFTIHSGDSVGIEAQREREVDSVKDLTPAQQNALENIRTTSRVDGRATDAQPVWEWANSAGGSGAAHASDIVVDFYGNTYIIGMFGNPASSAG